MITNKLENVYYINLKDREDRKKHVEKASFGSRICEEACRGEMVL